MLLARYTRQLTPLQFLSENALSYGLTFLFLALLIVIAFKLRSWFRDDSDPADVLDEMLMDFRELKRRGEVTDEEYRSIRSRLLNREADASADSRDADDGKEAE